MVKHIVLWTFKETANGRGKIDNIEMAREILEGLKGRIPQVRSLEVGVNFNATDGAWDLALCSEFATREDLEAYQNHPAHFEAVDFLRVVRDQRAVVDYFAPNEGMAQGAASGTDKKSIAANDFS
jgi:hypothetical protein